VCVCVCVCVLLCVCKCVCYVYITCPSHDVHERDAFFRAVLYKHLAQGACGSGVDLIDTEDIHDDWHVYGYYIRP
jgi:hypothetical protein